MHLDLKAKVTRRIAVWLEVVLKSGTGERDGWAFGGLTGEIEVLVDSD